MASQSHAAGSGWTVDEETAGAIELLLDAGIVLAETLDLQDTLSRVARLTVPERADLCVIDLRSDDGTISPVAAAAADDELIGDLTSLRERQVIDADGGHPVARVTRSGEPLLIAGDWEEPDPAFGFGPEHRRFIARANYNSAVVAPLLARGRTLGTLSVLRIGDGRPYGDGDVQLFSDLARRAALAIDNSRLYSQARESEQRLQATLVSLAEAVTLTDADDRIVFANQAAAELFGVRSPAELVGITQELAMARFLVLGEDGREIAVGEMPRRRLFSGAAAGPLLTRNIDRVTGVERWLVARPAPVIDPATGRIRYAVNVYEDVSEVKRAQLAEQFMAEASRVLASSMDYQETLEGVARLAVPRLAEWCAVDVLSEDGDVERLAVHHRDPAMRAVAERLDRDYRPQPHEQIGVWDVLRSGRARVYEDVTTEGLASYARDEEHLALLSALAVTSMIIVPLAAPAGTIGTLTLASSASSRRLTRADLGVAERLGRRAGTAVESARLNTVRARIANALQAALLPESLPAMPGLQIEALYRAAGELNEAGGDFYDVYQYGDGWMLTIGDVCGKGPRAAGATGLARHTLRTAAALGQRPAQMLQTLHQALRGQPPGADLVTVCLVTIRARGGRAELTVTLAGHPPPVAIGADGSTRHLGTAGTLLGVVDPVELSETGAALGAGETLLLYTDGLPEAGRASDETEQGWLRDCAAAGAEPSLGMMVEEIERAAVRRADGRLRDDIALLAVRPR